MFCHIIFHSVRQTFTLFLISEYLFTIMFVFFLFFPSPLVLWHICCCLVGRLCSPVINLFCRSPSALCLPLLLLLHLLSVAYFSSYMRASLHWHLMHGSLTPPPQSLISLLFAYSSSPTHCPLRKDERGAFLYVWLICYVKTLANNRLTAAAVRFYLRTNLSSMYSVGAKCTNMRKFALFKTSFSAVQILLVRAQYENITHCSQKLP